MAGSQRASRTKPSGSASLHQARCSQWRADEWGQCRPEGAGARPGWREAPAGTGHSSAIPPALSWGRTGVGRFSPARAGTELRKGPPGTLRRGRSGSPDPAPLLTTAGRAGRRGPCAELPPPIVNPAALPPAPGSSTWAESPAAGLLGTRSRSPNSGPGRLGPPPVVPGRHSPFHRGAPGLASGPRPSPPGAARQPSRGRRTAAASSGLRELVRARRAAAVTCAEAARAAVGGARGRGRERAARAVGASGGGGSAVRLGAQLVGAVGPA